MLHRIKAVIFDFDGTLLDVREAGIKQLIALHEKFGITLTERQSREMRDWRLDDIVAAFNAKLCGAVVSKTLIRNFLNQVHCELFPDVLLILRQLQQDGILALLISNRTSEDLTRKMREAGLNENYFFYVKGVEGTPAEKPNPDCLLEAVKLLRARNVIVPDEVICVGDHLLDMKVADAWNIRFFALTCGVTTRQKFIEASLPQSHIYSSLSDLFLK